MITKRWLGTPLWVTFLLLLCQLGLALPAQAETVNPFSPAEFEQVKPLLCDADTLEQLKVIKQTCVAEGFTVWSADLDGDGKSERLVFGPSGVCGAHGNCPLLLLKQVDARWEPFLKTPCQGESCLGWANSYATRVLVSKSQGHRDLLIGEDLGSFFWTKTIYRWDGNHYLAKPDGVTYFLVDSKVQLVQVPKARWEQCSKTGKNCLSR